VLEEQIKEYIQLLLEQVQVKLKEQMLFILIQVELLLVGLKQIIQ
jgi:hypothetical protein